MASRLNSPCKAIDSNRPCRLSPYSQRQSKQATCKIVMPPKKKPGVFEDLRRLNFFNLIGDILTFVIVVLFLLTFLELLLFHYLFSHTLEEPQEIVTETKEYIKEEEEFKEPPQEEKKVESIWKRRKVPRPCEKKRVKENEETIVSAETIKVLPESKVKEPGSTPKEPENKEAKINPIKPKCFGKTCSGIDAKKNKVKKQDLGRQDSESVFWNVLNDLVHKVIPPK